MSQLDLFSTQPDFFAPPPPLLAARLRPPGEPFTLVFCPGCAGNYRDDAIDEHRARCRPPAEEATP